MASMEARKKSGPFMPKWQKVKGRHKALSGKLFKPDIAAAIERYDQALAAYDQKLKEQDQLKGVIDALIKTGGESAAQIADLTNQLTQLTNKWRQDQGKSTDVLLKFAKSGGKASEAQASLDALISGAEAYVNKRKQLFDEIDGTAYNNLNAFKKAQKDFGDKAAAAEAEIAELESQADRAEAEIMSMLRDYIGIAEDADHPEIVKDLQSLKV